MPGKTSSRFSALKALYDTNPRVFEEFLQAFSEDLRIKSGPQGHAVSIACPHCNSIIKLTLETAVASQAKGPRALKSAQDEVKKIRKKTNFQTGRLNPLVLRLAKLRRKMVGDIHSEFTRHLGKKVKGMKKEEYRAKKEAWLKSEISKIGKKGKAA